jgi:hypothetical protein
MFRDNAFVRSLHPSSRTWEVFRAPGNTGKMMVRQFRILTACDKKLIEVDELQVHVRGGKRVFRSAIPRVRDPMAMMRTAAIENCVDVCSSQGNVYDGIHPSAAGAVLGTFRSFSPPRLPNTKCIPSIWTASEIPRTINCKASPLISFFRVTSRYVDCS